MEENTNVTEQAAVAAPAKEGKKFVKRKFALSARLKPTLSIIKTSIR